MDHKRTITTCNRRRKNFYLPGTLFCKKETISLPGFDENIYADNSHGNERTWKSLVEE
jgi:hypothetical protein